MRQTGGFFLLLRIFRGKLTMRPRIPLFSFQSLTYCRYWKQNIWLSLFTEFLKIPKNKKTEKCLSLFKSIFQVVRESWVKSAWDTIFGKERKRISFSKRSTRKIEEKCEKFFFPVSWLAGSEVEADRKAMGVHCIYHVMLEKILMRNQL